MQYEDVTYRRVLASSLWTSVSEHQFFSVLLTPAGTDEDEEPAPPDDDAVRTAGGRDMAGLSAREMARDFEDDNR